MNRKMILLNAVLAAVLVFAGYQWRTAYVAAKEKQRKMLNAKPPVVAAAPFVPLQNQPPVLATGYNQVAQKLLLHPSRNPDLPPPPPPEEPPPPPPMPPLPKYHGAMNLDGEAVAILSEKENAPFQEVKAGETIGQFKLVDVNTRDITFEWRQQQVRKSLNEILDRSSAASNNNNNNASQNAPAPPPPPQVVKSQIGPVGDANQFGTVQCDPNDSYPDGAVVNGRRKVSRSTPFGKACVWESVGR